MQHLIQARDDIFKDEVDPITLTPAFEIQHPIAFKDGGGGLKPPVYDMKSLRQWILGQNPTFPHTGLYSDLSQVAAVRWQRPRNGVSEEETVRMLNETQAALRTPDAEPNANFIFVFYDPNAHVFRQIMAAQFIRQQLNQPQFNQQQLNQQQSNQRQLNQQQSNQQSITNISWAHDYWVHHPYTPDDLNSNVHPIATTTNADAASFAEFRLGMARRLADEDLFGAMSMSYWSAHPIDTNNDSDQTMQAYARFHPTVVYSPLNDY
jgi:hypothetical protein